MDFRAKFLRFKMHPVNRGRPLESATAIFYKP